MTWREFQLKRHGFLRQQKHQVSQTRTIAYMIYLSIPEKGNKKTIEQFWSLDEKTSIHSDWQKEALREAQKLAVQEAKQNRLENGR